MRSSDSLRSTNLLTSLNEAFSYRESVWMRLIAIVTGSSVPLWQNIENALIGYPPSCRGTSRIVSSWSSLRALNSCWSRRWASPQAEKLPPNGEWSTPATDTPAEKHAAILFLKGSVPSLDTLAILDTFLRAEDPRDPRECMSFAYSESTVDDHVSSGFSWSPRPLLSFSNCLMILWTSSDAIALRDSDDHDLIVCSSWQ